MAGGELRRSYTQMDFSLNRVNIRPQLPHLFHQQPPLQMQAYSSRKLLSTAYFLLVCAIKIG
ncbi:hypothetical protein J6590_088095 [Homalodisca vitripennis]|nr:hypothetical protein J6590_088095 [Homalodisca vitripennis]